MAEKFSGGIGFPSQHFFHGLLCHTDTVVSNRNLQKWLAVRGRGFPCLNDNLSGTALGLNAVEERILYNRLERKAVNHAVIQLGIWNPAFQGYTASISVLLNQKIILNQRQLVFQGNLGACAFGDIFHQSGQGCSHFCNTAGALNGCHPFDGI